jgi:hypothetical protein
MFRQSAFGSFVPYFAAASLWASAVQGQAAPVPPSATEGAAAYAAPSGDPASHPAFVRGNEALAAGRNQDAIDAFSESYSANGDPASLMNLGIAYTNQGMLTHALEALTRYLARADATRDAQTIAAVQAEVDNIRSKNGVVVVNVTPDTASIQVDGIVLSPLNGELIVAPGQRRFVVFAEGYVNYDQKMAVAAGRFALDLALTPVSAVPVAAVAAVAPPAPPASPAQKAAMVADAEAVDEPEADETMNCALSSVCMGPVLALIGPPNLIGGGVHFRVGEYFGAGVDYQMTPSISFDPVSVGFSLFSVNARVYPFGGAFFLGGGFGYQSVRGEFENADVTVSANASFPAAMASIGFMGRNGFVLGMDLGVMFPLGSSNVEIDRMQVHATFNGMSVPQSEIDSARDEVKSQLRSVMDALPVFAQLNLIRVGYLF